MQHLRETDMGFKPPYKSLVKQRKDIQPLMLLHYITTIIAYDGILPHHNLKTTITPGYLAGAQKRN